MAKNCSSTDSLAIMSGVDGDALQAEECDAATDIDPAADLMADMDDGDSNLGPAGE